MATVGGAPPISVVVPTRNREARLGGCLASIRRSLRDGDELIVVDSASADSAGLAAIAAAHGARCLRCDIKGASRARNAGWRAAEHPVVAFVDDDMEVSPAWAEAVARSFAAHPDVAFVFGRIGIPEGQHEPRPVALKDELEPEVIDARKVRGTPGHSANMAVRREVLERLGGFDERLGAGGDFHASEDNDLLDRMVLAGLTGRYEPDANGWHDQWRSRVELARLDWGYGIGSGARIAKLLRRDRARAGHAIRELFWTWGFREILYFGRQRKEFLTGIAMVRVTGAVFGLARCLLLPIREGHFGRLWGGR